jgi:transcriptional regulator with XRE-family HTH domain
MTRKKEPGVVDQLKEAIRRSGMSLNELGRLCGVGSDRLSRFMTGKRDLTLSAVERICEALGLRLAPRSGRK